MKLMAENLKIISALDFEYFFYTRRSNLIGIVMDAVVAGKVLIRFSKLKSVVPTEIKHYVPVILAKHLDRSRRFGLSSRG